MPIRGADGRAIETDRRANPLTYANETDNFNQPHYHLHNIYNLSEQATLTNTLYYIRGKGYYEQYKPGRITGNTTSTRRWWISTLKHRQPYASGDLVRQQWVHKNQFGWNPRLDIDHSRGKHSVGGSFYYFDSDHWGQVVWAQHISGALDPRHRYYQYYGRK